MEKHHKVADNDHETSKGLLTKTKAYKQFSYRWIILFCYLSVAFINGIGYQSFIPNAKQFINLYSVGEQIITLTGTIFLIMQPVFTFFASTFIVKFGFAVSMNFGVFLTIIGYSLRLLINEFSFTFAIIGQACLGIGRPFIINGQTSLAQNWFFPSNRTAVITTCNAFQTVSMVISVLWPANWVFKNYEYSTENKGEGLDLAMTLVKQQFYLSLALIPGMFLVRNNPKTPPSGFANSDKDIGFKESIIKLFTNKNFILIFLTFSIFFGTVKGFGLAVPYLMSPFGFVDNQYSIVSSMLVIGGFLSAGLVSKIVLKFKKYKAIGIVLFSISIILALLTYPLLLLGNIYLLYIQQLLLGFFLIPMVPVLVEYSCESIYPLNGSFSVGVMVSGSTILALLSSMLLTYTVKGKDSDKISVLTTTTIWCLFYISGFLLYLFTKEILNRSKEIEERAASKHSLFFGQSQLKASINQPEEDEIIGDYPTEHPVADSHQFMANPQVFDPDIIMSRTNLGSPSYYFSCSAPKLESIQNGSPKKEFFDASRQLEKAKKRVQLLKIENELREKKAQVQIQKNETLNRIREDHEQFKEFKQMHREQVNVQLQNLVSRTRNLKRQQSQEKIVIQQNFLQMKQQEVKNIKEQSQKNEVLIRQNLDNIKQQKYEQKQQILTYEQQAQQTVANFRKQKYLRYQQEHYQSKSQHMVEAENKLSIIEELRKQEAHLLQKLETTSKMNTSLVVRQLSTTTPKAEFNN